MINDKPNLFQLATNELSQDSFFAWLLQWADAKYHKANSALNETAGDFIKLLIGKTAEYQITTVEANRQWHNIDVWAEINGEYFLGIEDKTNTGEHSGQLETYKQKATEHYRDTNYKLAFVYLKTGNESSSTLKKIEEKGYLVIDRKAILNVLRKRPVQNEIFDDFKAYLETIEALTNSYTKFESLTTEWKAAEGFYIKLQELLPKWSHWEYVPNQSGGFLGFWYHWVAPGFCSLYIQIENAFARGIKVVVKISDWEPEVDTLYQILSDLQPYAKKYSLSIRKPHKYNAKVTSTLGVLENPFTVDPEGNIDMMGVMATLKNLEKVLDEYSSDKIKPIEIVDDKI